MATLYWIGVTSGNFQTSTNWVDSAGSAAAPGNNDTLIFSSISATYNAINAGLSNSLTGIKIIIEPGFTGTIGTYAAGVLTYLVLDGGTLTMPASPNNNNSAGSSMIAINFGSTAATINIETSNTTAADASLQPVMLKGSALTITQSGGVVGIASRGGETATLTSGKMGRGQGAAPVLYLGAGVTLTSLTMAAGQVLDARTNTGTTVKLEGDGAFYRYTGTGATTTLTVDAGKAQYDGTGTITNANINRGTLDISQDQRSKTLTNTTLRKAGVLLGNSGVAHLTFTNAISIPEGLFSGMLSLSPAQACSTQ